MIGSVSRPQVDVGISVYDRANYVAEAIASVVAQTYPYWHLTISQDGGSTEAMMRAVEPFLADQRIRYVTPGRHLGEARHKSSLVAHGSGKYVAVLDDDDCWAPEWLGRRVEFLERHAECVLVCSGHLDVDVAGTPIRQSDLPFADGVHSSSEFVRRMMSGNLVGTPSVLFRRAAYVRAGGAFDSRFLHISDYELWLRLGLLGPVGFLPVHDWSRRVHPRQRSRRHDRAIDHLRLIDHLDDLLASTRPELRLPEAARRQQKANGFLSAALDAAEAGERRLAARRIASAAGLAPGALVSPRGLAAIAALAAGTALSRRIGTLRS